VTDAAIVFSNLRDRVENRIDGLNADASIGADRKIRITGSARAGEHPLKFDIKATAPAPPLERQNVPVDLTLDAPDVLQAPLSGRAEVRLNGSVVMINGLTGTLGDGAFNGWASVDLASKPLVKLDLDFQRLDIAVAPAAAAGAQSSPPSQAPQTPWSNAAIDVNGLNYVDAQIRVSAAALNIGEGAFRAGRDRRHAQCRRAQMRHTQSRGLWRPGQWRTRHRRLRRQSGLHAARRSRRRARAAAAARRRRLRQARRQAAGQDRGAFRRPEPARHHVGSQRHGIRGISGRRHQGPQRRADDPLADVEHAVGVAGEPRTDHRPLPALGLVPDRARAGHLQRSQPGRARS
jgi:hypothetical protein